MLVGEDKNKVRNILNENFSNHEQYRKRRQFLEWLSTKGQNTKRRYEQGKA
jgi:hypothetical protein